MSDNPYSLDEDDQANPLAQIRAHAEELEKELKAERKAKAALEVQVAEAAAARKSEQAKAAFTALNLNPMLADLYLKTAEGDVTQEGVQTFAQTYGFSPPEPTPEPEPEPVPAFVPVTGANPPAQEMSMADWKKFYLVNPAAALQAFEQGRVKAAT